MKTTILKTTAVFSFLSFFFLITNCKKTEPISPKPKGCCSFPKSEDGKYTAIKNGISSYVVIDDSGKKLFSTHAKYYDSNDIKAAGFGKMNGKPCFCSVYHYGHTYSSWADIWSLDSLKEYSKEISGYNHSACWVFN